MGVDPLHTQRWWGCGSQQPHIRLREDFQPVCKRRPCGKAAEAGPMPTLPFLVQLARQQAFNRADALDGPERFFLARQRVALSGCKMRMAGVLVRKVLPPAQPEEDHEQRKGATRCSEAQRTTTFCSAVCNTAGMCRKARLQRFGDCCHAGCFFWLLFARDNFGYFSPARHKGKQWPASNKTGVIPGRKSSGKEALLAWAGHAGNSPEVCSAIVPMHLRCCPRMRAWGGSRCHGHPARPCQGQGATWKRQGTSKSLLRYHYCTSSFKKWIWPTATSHFFPVCDAKLKQLSQSFSFVLSASDPISWQTAGSTVVIQMLIYFILMKVNLCALLMVCMWDRLALLKKIYFKPIAMPPGFLSFRPPRRSYSLFSISHYCEAARLKRHDLHVVLTMFSGCQFVCSMQS